MATLVGGLFAKENFLSGVGKEKLREDEKLDALRECLEGPIRDTWSKSYTDRADSSNPLTYSELFALLQGRGSKLPEDRYRTLLISFPTIPKLILHEFQNKQQCFESLVNEAESAGEHPSDGELKAIIFGKMPADTAASLKQEQSQEEVKSWWTKVTRFPKGSGHFQDRDALKKCASTNFSKCKEKDGNSRLKFAENEDRDIFNKVVNRGHSFGGTQLVAKPWIFSFTPTELWEELEKLADANHQQFHKGWSRNPPSKGGNAKNVNDTQSKDCAICLSFGQTNRAKSHSTENHWWNKTDAERVAQEASEDPPKAPVMKVDENRQSTPSGKGKGFKGQQTCGGKENQSQSSQGRSPEDFRNGNGKSNCAKGNGGKGNFVKRKGQSSGHFSGHSKGMSAGRGKATSQGTRGGQGKGSSGQRNPHSGRAASVHHVAGSKEDYYNNVTTEGEDAPDKEGNLVQEGLGDQWEDENVSWETLQQEYEEDYQEKRRRDCVAIPHTIRRFPECPIVDIGALAVGPTPVEADGDRNVTEIGVPNKYGAGKFICRLWVTDKKGNTHLATCLRDNGSEVNLQ